ncbi:MAG: molybdopterin molybdenumtransferase MoeA [Anaerolineaceae bacterium]|nr:molybdopterin molybdenumtransferase MoeA [Anaerolineaceae bacterium]
MKPVEPAIPLARALEIVLEHARRLPPLDLQIDAAAGRVLAEEVRSDMDLPPFDKSAMDGYALRADDIATVPSVLEVVEDIPAGRAPERFVEAGQCAKIMTGAPVPRGADTVVMVEHTESSGDDEVRILRTAARGRNICFRGEDVKEGAVVACRGTVLSPLDVALVAAAGRACVPVYGLPTVAILATGDEIIEPQGTPRAGQIRNSNSHALAARLRESGIQADYLGIAPDEQAALRAAIEDGLRRDVLIVSGGVSMGDYDLVPGVLAELSVELIFQRVAVKPGRPTVFGTRGGTIVFGLPGNPVSTLVIAELLVVPALLHMMGREDAAPTMVEALLEGPLSHRGNRMSFRPVALRWCEGVCRAAPVEYHGSADLAGAARGNAFALIPEGTKQLAAGSRTQVLMFPESAP